MSGSTSPPPALRALAGKHLAWPTWDLAHRGGQTIQGNLGVASGTLAVIPAHFAEPEGWGFAMPDAAFLGGVAGHVVRDGVLLADDSPPPSLTAPAETLALDLRGRLEAMGGTRLADFDAEIEATGGAAALALTRAPGRVFNRLDSAETDALAAIGLAPQQVSNLLTAAQQGAAGSEMQRDRARRERRRRVEAARAGGA